MIDLRHGNCLELMKSIPDGSVDMILTDPPYGTVDCKWDKIVDLDLMWSELNRIIKPNGAIVLFAQMSFAVKVINSSKVPFRYDLIWQKTSPCGHLNANKMPLRSHELLLVFYKKLPTYAPQKHQTKLIKSDFIEREKNNPDTVYNKHRRNGRLRKDDGTRHPLSILSFNNTGNELNANQFISKRLHPTQKPVDLLEFLIKSYTNEDEAVLDFTMGSGSTGVACLNTNRRFIGIEKDDHYFNVATKRINEHKATIQSGFFND